MTEETKPPTFEKWERVPGLPDFSGLKLLKPKEHFDKAKKDKSKCYVATTVNQLKKLKI